eukprot:GILJ01001471.1.p1 GENE.GILJ01001471.1~~GILJ01001471.1.p1  ORF type:complete len:283 (-),score=37.31 GILJ01001471.1:219-1067(-)
MLRVVSRLRPVVRCRWSSSQPVQFAVEKLTGENEGITVFTMQRPEAKNALSRLMMQQFREALDSVQFDSTVRVVVLRSAVEGVFCAGADLKERTTMAPEEVSAFVDGLRRSFADLENLPMPTIAALEGSALGGGLELALSCDFRIAGANAKLGLPETSLAIIPGAGGTQRLPRLIGVSKAKELTFTARRIDSVTAKSIGLVNDTAEAGKTFDKALELAREIVPQGPIGVRMAKLAIHKGSQLDLASGLAFEQACYAQVIPTKDREEGLRAFKEKRKPIYKGC